jgi:hypothetical protein
MSVSRKTRTLRPLRKKNIRSLVVCYEPNNKNKQSRPIRKAAILASCGASKQTKPNENQTRRVCKAKYDWCIGNPSGTERDEVAGQPTGQWPRLR